MRAILMTIFGLLTVSTVKAAPLALAEIVQSPAWVERAGKRLPLVAGMTLQNRDRIITGDNARVVIGFVDGSQARLGEDALLVVNAMEKRENGSFAGGMDVRQGDLRLVSHDYREDPVKRAINVRFGDITAAVRSEADITGLSEEPRDAVALRDGRAMLSHSTAGRTELNEALQVYEVPRGQAPLPVYKIDRFAGAEWALRSQPLYDGGSLVRGGNWRLDFGVFDKPDALALYDRLRAAGYPVRIRPTKVDKQQRYELRLGGLATEREALSLAERLSDESAGVPRAEVRQGR